MANNERPATETPYLNDPNVREAYADTVRAVFTVGPMMHLEFAVTRPEVTGVNQSRDTQVTSARVVLSPAAVLQLHDMLVATVASLENNGMLRRITPGSSVKQ